MADICGCVVETTWQERYDADVAELTAALEEARREAAYQRAEAERYHRESRDSAEMTGRAVFALAELTARAERTEAVLRNVLAHFTERGHPGKPCLRTGWVGVGRLAAWRSVLDEPTEEHTE